jgi:hypothetical protein
MATAWQRPGRAGHVSGPRRSWIARERLVEDVVPAWFWYGVATLFLATLAVGGYLATLAPEEPLGLEAPLFAGAEAEGPVVLQVAFPALGLMGARLLTAIFMAAGVAAVAVAAHRLWHSPGAGLLAGALVGADPALLSFGHLASAAGIVFGIAMVALALLLLPARGGHWVAAGLVFLATFLHPGLLVWSIALFVLVLLRGHIYAAPKHVIVAGAQTILPMAIGALLAHLAAVGAADGIAACLTPSTWRALSLASVAGIGGTRHAVHNAAVWYGGLAALLYLASGAIGTVLSSFRLQRLPGRLQVRLPRPLARHHGRALWLLVLVLFVPVPFLWLPLFAMALAGGVWYLSEDAPGFGFMVGLLIAAAALFYAVRLWGLVHGTATPQEAAELLHIVPWMTPVTC